MVDALLLRPPQLSGRVNASGTVTGTTDAPQAEGRIHDRARRLPSVPVRHVRRHGQLRRQGMTLDTRLQQNPTTWIEAKGRRFQPPLFDETGSDVGRPDRSPHRQHADRSRDRPGLHDGADRRDGDARGARRRHRHGRRSPSRRRRDHSKRRVHGRADRRQLHGSRRPDRSAARSHPHRPAPVLDNHESRCRSPAIWPSRAPGRRAVQLYDQRGRLQGDRQRDGQRPGQQRICRSPASSAPRIEGDLGVTTGAVNLDPILAILGDSAYSTKQTEYTTVADAAGAGSRSAPSRPGSGLAGLIDTLQMDVRLTVPNDLVVKASDLRAPGRPDRPWRAERDARRRSLCAPRSRTISFGCSARVNTVRGNYDFQGRRFEILRDGTVRSTASTTSIRLDIRTRADDPGRSTAHVNVRGTLKQPEIVLSSTPPLEQADILSLIVFNQPINQLGEGQQISLAQRAQALATGAVAGQLAQSIGNALDLDMFEISTCAGERRRRGADDRPAARAEPVRAECSRASAIRARPTSSSSTSSPMAAAADQRRCRARARSSRCSSACRAPAPICSSSSATDSDWQNLID